MLAMEAKQTHKVQREEEKEDNNAQARGHECRYKTRRHHIHVAQQKKTTRPNGTRKKKGGKPPFFRG